MNSLIARISILSLAGCVAVWSAGCNKTTEKGGPGAKKTPEGGVQNKDNTFELGLPDTTTDIEVGKTQTITINVKRGDQFKQPVTLEFADAEGLTFKPDDKKVAADKDSIDITISVAADAKEGERSIKVTGKPDEGDSVDGTISVKVNKAGS